MTNQTINGGYFLKFDAHLMTNQTTNSEYFLKFHQV